MSKKEKYIEVQVVDAQVVANGQTYDGVQLLLGKKVIGEIAELSDKQFAVLKNANVETFFKNLDQAITNVLENYNLNH